MSCLSVPSINGHGQSETICARISIIQPICRHLSQYKISVRNWEAKFTEFRIKVNFRDHALQNTKYKFCLKLLFQDVFLLRIREKKTLNQIQLITPENTITYHNALCLSLKSLQAGKHCLQFLLGVKMAPGETENDAYEKFWGDKQRTLWHVTVFLEWTIASTFQIRTRT